MKLSISTFMPGDARNPEVHSNPVKWLTDALAMTNNGYLFAPTALELSIAKAHPNNFSVVGGTIYPKSFKGAKVDRSVNLEHYKKMQKANLPSDDFDYEGAILTRQSKYDL